MKLQIRNKVFETNSSSTHSITMVPEEDFQAWRRGEMFFSIFSGKLVSTEKAEEINLNIMDREGVDNWDDVEEKYDGAITYDDWQDDYELESYVEHYTTPGGEKIVAFGKYGHD